MQIHIFFDGQAGPAAAYELPDDPEARARGRNGWFRPRQITIWRGVRVVVAVSSRRPAGAAPVQLHLAPATAHALGQALLLAAAPEDQTSAAGETTPDHTEDT